MTDDLDPYPPPTEPPPPLDEPEPNYPGVGQALGLLALVVVFQGVIFAAIGVAGEGMSPPVTATPIVLGVVNLLSFAIVVAWGWWRTGQPWSTVFSLRRFPLAMILPIGLVVLGGGIVLSEVDNLFRSVFPIPEAIAELFEGLGAGEAGVMASLFVLVLVAPVTEELLFRGLILRGLLSRYSTRRAIVISALMFGALHLNPWQFIPTTLGGLLLAWLTLNTGTLWPAILTHALNNSASALAPRYLDLDIPGYSGGLTGEVMFQPLWFDAVGLVLLGTGLSMLVRKFATGGGALAMHGGALATRTGALATRTGTLAPGGEAPAEDPPPG